MQLTDIGFDGWFEGHAAAHLQPGQRLARVTAVDRGAFLVRDAAAEFHAELAGKFSFAAEDPDDLPCVGDWVGVRGDAAGGAVIIHSVLPRKTCLRRKSPGKTVDFQLIAANIDVAFIMQACGYDFNLGRLDRYLVTVGEAHIDPWIILSKTDLISAEELAQTISRLSQLGISAPILPVSNATSSGLEEIRALLRPGRTYCFIGSSGVGKTTLINRMIGHDTLDTRAVSGTGEGVHTTARRQLLTLPGGAMLIDTPGMRELGLVGTGDGLDETFAEIGDCSLQCRFADCTHTGEPGCAVLLAVQNGTLSEERYKSFLKLKKESEFHDLSYVEKRRKDKSFGRFIKSAKKTIKE